MKNTNKLLVVLLAVAVLISGIAVTTLTTSADAADTTVYLEYDGVDCNVAGLDEGWHTDRARGDSLNIDYYEKDMYAPMTDDDKASLEVGKVYKAVYIYTFNNVNEPGWEFKFMPTEEYYFNITNGDVWKGEAGTKTAVVVPFKVTNQADVKLKTWQHGGMTEDSTIDQILVVGADFNAYTIEDVNIVVEGLANAGSKKDENKPADDEWTASDKYFGQAPADLGMNSTLYYMPTYGQILEEDSYGASVSFENNTKFDASIDAMINSSYLVEETSATSISIHGDGDWFIQKWTGTMTPLLSGDVTLIGRKIDNGFVMLVNGQKVYEYWGASHWFDGANDRLPYGSSFTVVAGQEYEVEIYYLELGGGNALEIFATDTPNDVNSGANINQVATFDLTMQKYVIGDNTAEFNKLVGAGSTEEEGNAQCTDDNAKYASSIDAILAKTVKGESKVVETFADAVVNKECYVVLYDGYIEPKVSGTYVFGAAKVDNGFYLNIDGTVAYEFWAGSVWNDKGGNTYSEGIELEAGKRYPFNAAFLETNGGQTLQLVASVDDEDAVSIDELFTFYTSNGEAGSGDDNGSGNGSGNGNAGDNNTNKPATGDVASVVAILTAGFAAIGGLKLRKR